MLFAADAATSGITEGQFGSWVSLDNDVTLVVGSMADSMLYNSAGSAYLFRQTALGANDWLETQKLVGPDSDFWDNFGYYLAINDGVIAVGAYKADNYGTSRGAVYVWTFDSSSDEWIYTIKLFPTSQVNNDYFGYAVDTADGHIVVGAYSNDNAVGTSAGAAYIYSPLTNGGYTQEETHKFTAPSGGGAMHFFGESVAIDDEVFVSCTSFDNLETGTCYTFNYNKDTSLWDFSTQIYADDAQADMQFGQSVAMHGRYMIVGAYKDSTYYLESGAAYVFARIDTDSWLQLAKLFDGQNGVGDWFGWPVDIHFPYAIAGAKQSDVNSNSEVGTAHLFQFDTLPHVCNSNPCEYGTLCIPAGCGVNDAFSCICNELTSGATCDVCACDDVGGSCISNADYCNCTNVNAVGVMCDKSCNAGVVNDLYTECNCTNSGAYGKYCQHDIDDCASDPCMHDGVCTDLGLNAYNCTCPSEYYGPICNDTLCYSSPCMNNGTCMNGVDMSCQCKPGYEGLLCETEINECLSNPCLNDGVCHDMLLGFTCQCDGTGYAGDICQSDADDCASSPCFNGGVCKDKGVNDFKCNCVQGYQGGLCQHDINECASSPCLNGGQCLDLQAEYLCDCNDTAYTGLLCHESLSSCISSPCQNGGVCTGDEMTFNCSCSDMYDGITCTDVLSCLSQPCQDGYTCIEAQDGYACECSHLSCNSSMSSSSNSSSSSTEQANDVFAVVLTLTFTDFESSNETIESFEARLPALLSEAIMGDDGHEEDFTLAGPMELTEDGYVVDIIFANPNNMEPTVIKERVMDTDSPVVDATTNLDVPVVERVENEEEEDKQEEDDAMIIVVIIIIITVIIAGVAGWYLYQNKMKKTGKFDVMSMPV